MFKGISIWSFANKTLKQAFELAKQAGFEGVEVALAEEGEIALDTTQKQLSAVCGLAQDCGIKLYSVASGLYWKYSLTADDQRERQKAKDIVKRQIDVAAQLKCDTILVIPGAVSVSFAPELGVVDYLTAYDRSLAAFAELAPYAQKSGIDIGLENVWNNFLLSPLEMRDFIDKIGSPNVGSYFDVGNVVYSGYPEQWIRILGNRIKKVHFKDYRRSVGGLDGFVDLLAGDVNYPEVIKALRQTGYNGWVTAEMLPPYTHFPDAIVYNTSCAMDNILTK